MFVTKYEQTKEEMKEKGCYITGEGKYQRELAIVVRDVIPTKDYTTCKEVNLLKAMLRYYVEVHNTELESLKEYGIFSEKDLLRFCKPLKKDPKIKLNSMLFILPIETLDMQKLEYQLNRLIRHVYTMYMHGDIRYNRSKVWVNDKGEYTYLGPIREDLKEEIMDATVVKRRKVYKKIK